MKKEKHTYHALYRLISFFTFLFLTISVSFSQEINGSACEKYIPKSTKIKLNPKDNTIQYFKLSADSKVNSTDACTYLVSILKLNKEISLKVHSKETDKIGYTHTRYKFYFKSILIEDFTYIIHSKNDLIVSGNGEYSKISNFNNSNPLIKNDEAIKIGKSKLKSEKYYWKENEFPQPELNYILINNSFKLCYKTDIYSVKPLARKYFYIDAENGKILKEINRIQHTDVIGTAHTKYNGVRSITTNQQGANFILTESGRGNGINTFNLNNGTDYSNYTNFTDTDNNWTSTLNQDDAALDVHFGAEAFYDYYSSTFGRNSFDNSNSTINSFVHYDTNFVNAFWDGTNITYGDGDGINYSALTSLDVVGHELTHAVTQYTANLQYINESGALNESFSDIFGVVIDFYKNPTTANYLMGDQFNITGNGFRDMSNPNAKNDPDTYLGNHWVTDPNFDNGGVHSNSGVQNYWFYLLVNGGSGTNDLNDNYSVTGIGLTKAAEISYRNLTSFLTANSNYNDARFYSIQSAIDLYGECSPEVIAVTNAWHAVGVGEIYTSEVIANFNVDKQISCSVPSSVHFYNFSTNAIQFHWDLGDGTTSTSDTLTHTYTTVGNYTIRLIANGTGICNSPDTLTLINFISITNDGSLTGAICKPKTTYPSTIKGISKVIFNTINKTSQFSKNESYQDFSCSQSTSLMAGSVYNLEINSGLEFGKAWIDYNNNGDFEVNEVIYSSDNKKTIHISNVIISGNTAYNTPLRLRIGTNEEIGFDACTNPIFGQFEDYTITIIQNSNPPIANFTASTFSTSINNPITFSDLSLNLPTTWTWEFTGANTLNSSSQNPVISYPAVGTYPVKLVVTNAFGEDSITKINFITIVNTYFICSDSYSNLYVGKLIDSGTESNNYNDNENCNFLVQPPTIKPIRITLNSFDTEQNYDFLKIYDGPDQNSPLLISISGILNTTSFIANSGNVFFEWSSDIYITSSGFDISWDTLDINTGGIIATGNFIQNQNIQFQSIYTNSSYYHWDFGDGSSINGSFNQLHSYQNPGQYLVGLSYYDLNFNYNTYYKNITIESNLGLNNKNEASSFLLYPNPTNDIINIKNNSEFKINSITIKNSIGQRINTIYPINKGEKNAINLYEFSTGIYYIEVLFENGEQSIQKVIKTN
jgi:Zn-dependent metalloprotease